MATVVHDLKNSLSIIGGLGQLGGIISSTEKEREYFDRIIKQVDTLTDKVTIVQMKLTMLKNIV